MRNSGFLLAAMSNLKFFLAASFLLFAPFSIPAQSQMNDSERQLFDALNRERASQSLPALQWDDKLAKAARLHANRMAFYNVIEHQLSGEPALEVRLAEAGARFGSIAENIAVGPNPTVIHAGWMDSPGHRANILNSNLTAVGIAAVRGRGGLFAVEDFSQSVTVLSLEQQEKNVAALLTAMGWRVAEERNEARKTCASDGLAGTGARSMIRFETSDLSKLPEDVEKKIRSRPNHEAAVGACHANSAPGFAKYRIAVLFF
jgi:uncharacterized protein YkwD